MTTKYDYIESLVLGRRASFFKVLEVVSSLFPEVSDAFLIGAAIQVAYQRDQKGATEYCEPYDRNKEPPWKHRAFCMRGVRYEANQIGSVMDATATKNYVAWSRDRDGDLHGYALAHEAIQIGKSYDYREDPGRAQKYQYNTRRSKRSNAENQSGNSRG